MVRSPSSLSSFLLLLLLLLLSIFPLFLLNGVDDSPAWVNKTEWSRPILLARFAEHLQWLAEDSKELDPLVFSPDRRINVEYRLARTAVVPYDANRVRLLDVEKADGSDYINASPIELPFANNRAHPPARYIAAMGPTKETSPHFLQMLWEQRAPAVVALTKCKEEGEEKCHEYWPTKKEPEKKIGEHFKVKLIGGERVEHGLTIREVELWDTTAEAEKFLHRFLHFHYEDWADFGVVESPAHLVAIIRIFRAELHAKFPRAREEELPSVVHCSAGAGRTGVFIATHHLIEDIPREFGGEDITGDIAPPPAAGAAHLDPQATLDVFGCVCVMRVSRPEMVYTRDQYALIYTAVLYAINGGDEVEALAVYKALANGTYYIKPRKVLS